MCCGGRLLRLAFSHHEDDVANDCVMAKVMSPLMGRCGPLGEELLGKQQLERMLVRKGREMGVGVDRPCASMTPCGFSVCAEPVAVTPLAPDTRTQPGPDPSGQVRRAPLRAVAYEKDML